MRMQLYCVYERLNQIEPGTIASKMNISDMMWGNSIPKKITIHALDKVSINENSSRSLQLLHSVRTASLDCQSVSASTRIANERPLKNRHTTAHACSRALLFLHSPHFVHACAVEGSMVGVSCLVAHGSWLMHGQERDAAPIKAQGRWPHTPFLDMSRKPRDTKHQA